MKDWICRLLGHAADVLVLDGGALRVRCRNCGWTSPGQMHLPAPKVTQPGDEATRSKVLPFLKERAL